jgi:Fe-S cluster assembly iron-binding protein IscA
VQVVYGIVNSLQRLWYANALNILQLKNKDEEGVAEMIELGFKALEKLKEKLLESCYDAGIGYRILVTKKESGEISCVLKLGTKREGDHVIEFEGMRIFLDPLSAFYMRDSELQFLDMSNDSFILRDNR